MEKDKALHVIDLDVRNILRIKTATVAFDSEGAIIIGGKNAAGKSSLLNAIWIALGGADAVPGEPVRKGAESGEVTLNLGEFSVTRKMTPGNRIGSLTIKGADGKAIKQPQSLLDSLLGKIAFDPTEFLRLDETKQAVTLRQLAGIDLSKFDVDYKAAYDARRDKGSEVKAQEGVVAALDDPGLADEKPVDLAPIQAELDGIKEKEAERETLGSLTQTAKGALEAFGRRLDAKREELDASQNKVVDWEEEIEALQTKIQAEGAKQEAIRADGREIKKLHDAAKESAAMALEAHQAFSVPSAVEISNRMSAAKEKNAAIETSKRVAAARAKLNVIRADHKKLDARVSDIETAKREALTNAKYPIDGLAVTESGAITFKGLPINQASSAERLKIAMSIGMVLNRHLKLMRFANGNDLDAASMRQVDELARAGGYQVMIERVMETAEGASVFIEDGNAIQGEKE